LQPLISNTVLTHIKVKFKYILSGVSINVLYSNVLIFVGGIVASLNKICLPSKNIVPVC